MTKKIVLFIFGVLFSNAWGYTQQSIDPSLIKFDLFKNRDVFFNQKVINPCLIIDSSGLGIDYILDIDWAGNNSPISHIFTGESHFSSIKSSVGLTIDLNKTGNLKKQSYLANYSFILSLSKKSALSFGLNLGIYRYNAETFNTSDLLMTTTPKWTNSPIMEIAGLYKYKNHNIGLSYSILETKLSNQDSYLVPTGLIANYSTKFHLNRVLSIQPILLGYFDSKSTYTIISMRINFKNKVSSGLLYNTNDSFGFLLSGVIGKRIKVGYYYDFKMKETIDNSYGSHNFNIGVKI